MAFRMVAIKTLVLGLSTESAVFCILPFHSKYEGGEDTWFQLRIPQENVELSLVKDAAFSITRLGFAS
jgi:hypothetical protein